MLRTALTPARGAVLLVLVFIVVAGSAMLWTSPSFDEIVFMASGARGFHMGDFGLVGDHPRLPTYFFGLLPYLSGVKYPSEAILVRDWYPPYHYAEAFLWGVGNNPERIVMMSRLVGLTFGALTVGATYLLAKRSMGAGAALFAAALVAFLPDMLAHSGLAYSDVPLTLGFLASVYALDAAVRKPTSARIALAAFACALTACVKYSAILLGPVLAALLVLEALSGRWRDVAWRRSVLVGIPLFVAVTYVTIALVYLGDWRLAAFIEGLETSLHSASAGRTSFLLGERYVGGRWYFFPVAFALKTPVALHVFVLIAMAGAWAASGALRRRAALAHPARAPAVGAAVFLAALLTSNMNVGFRYALPMMPLLCILVAQGLATVWIRGRTAMRAALAAIFATFLLSSLVRYPYFFAYLSEYAHGRPLYATLVESSTDWGQGLVALRSFMRERGIAEVALAYFGSVPPEGYGIRYVAMPSYFDLPPGAPPEDAPRYLVVSATLLAGLHVEGDPYAALREVEPVAIVAGTLYVYDRQAVAGKSAAKPGQPR